MIIRTARDLGLLLRGRRRELQLSQAELATRIGATRQWVIEIERGKPRAEIGLVLNAMKALQLDADIRSRDRFTAGRTDAAIDLDAILDRARLASAIPTKARPASPKKRRT